MCGILGILPAVNKEKFTTALSKLQHRGPDGFEVWENDAKQIMLGHRRLAIIDLSAQSNQPFHYKHLTVCFNGEIYNFIELKKELQILGFTFTTDGDTEVIAAAYLAWGVNALKKFNGMWALSIWNNKTNELLISRDRFGKKPFFYSISKTQFVFGSEMKAITPFLNEVNISSSFNWCKNNLYIYEASEKCLIESIKRLPASSYAIYKLGDEELNIQRFWNVLDYVQPNQNTYEQQVDEFRHLFEDACKLRLRSDVKVGSALSGGLDSSAIIATISKIAKTNGLHQREQNGQHAVVASFPGSKIDETYYAKKVIDHLHIESSFVQVDVQQSISQFEDYIYKFEEIYTTPPHPMIETYKAIKQNGITVSLDGHGADELLSGYGNDLYQAFYDVQFNPTAVKQIIETRLGLVSEEFTLKNYLQAISYPTQQGLKKILHSIGNWLPSLQNNFHMPVSSAKYIDELGHFNSLLYHGFINTTLPTLLRNFDRVSMAASVEIRMPFLDYRLVNFIFSLPWHSKIRNGFTKNILRDAVAPLLPNEVVYRKNKIGFNAPTSLWVKHGWKDFFLDTVHSTAFNNCTLINPREVKNLVLKTIANSNEEFKQGYKLWYSIAPFFWEQYFYKNVQQPK